MIAAPALTRRGFVHLVGRAGGAGAAYATLAAMGLLPVPEAYAGPPPAAQHGGAGAGRRVAILGAGIAGMVAALELRKAGHRCTVLEARARPGGRVWTVRGGDTIAESDSRQRVAWPRAPHLYLNAGAARLPHHHQGILAYCRELGVALDPIVNENRACFVQDDGAFEGRPLRLRQVVADSRGAVAELAAKALDRGALDRPLNAGDIERLRAFLKAFGRLGDDLTYRGSGRAGWAVPPAAGDEAGRRLPPLDLAGIARGRSWLDSLFFAEGWEQAATMLEPRGGMDAIPLALARALGGTIAYNAEVAEIRRVGDGARVVWIDHGSGRRRALEAEVVLCTLPLPALARIDADLAPRTRAAIAAGAATYVPAVKVAFHSPRRWWETDHQIYGGISWTGRDATQIWYPSANIHGRDGIVVGAYVWSDDIGRRFAAMTPAQRAAAAVADGERIHPGYGARVGRPASVAWSRVPFSGGAWAEWDQHPAGEAHHAALREPDGPIHFAGEHLSHIHGWQEGALRSAHHALARIAERARAGAG